ncbi:MAG: SPOR domain-containing protein [Myxococcota bacterium]
MERRIGSGVFGMGLFEMAMGLLVATLAQAGDYTVQIGAFRNAPGGFAAEAEAVGPLRTTENAEGVTRFRIGEYGSVSEAEIARAALVAAGYADAFVIRARGGAPVAARTAEPMRSSRRAADPLAGVPANLRARVVVLDGAYHVKDGERFIPLDEALRAEAGR